MMSPGKRPNIALPGFGLAIPLVLVAALAPAQSFASDFHVGGSLGYGGTGISTQATVEEAGWNSEMLPAGTTVTQVRPPPAARRSSLVPRSPEQVAHRPDGPPYSRP